MTTADLAIYVRCWRCETDAPETDVEIENIAEDHEGRDLVTFVCQNCGTIVKSFRFSK